MKKNFLSKIKIAILGFTFIAAALSVAGCKTNVDDSKVVYSDGKAHLKMEVNSSDARTIFPNIQVNDLTAISLSYKEGGDSNLVFGIWDDYDSFSKADVALDAGARYTFELNAYKNGTKLTSDKVNLTLVKGENPIAFDLHVSDTGSDNGTIEIKALFGADIELASASAALLKADNFEQYYEISNLLPYVKSAENGSHYIVFTKDDVPVAEDTFGKYWLEMNFTTIDGKIAQIRDYIWVSSGCVSGDTYDLDKMWADKLSLASALYDSTNTHVSAVGDPDGNGVKFTLNFQDDDKMWLQYSIFEEESELATSTRTCWTPENVPTKENRTVEIVYPFTEDNKTYVFELRIWPSKKWVSTSDEGYADAIAVPGYSVWDDGCDYIAEKVIVTANGGNTEIINPRASNVLKQAKLELSSEDAKMHLTEDIKSYFVKSKLNAEYDSLVNVNVHNGKSDWSDACGTYGFEISADDYDSFIDVDNDGSEYEISDEELLETLSFKNNKDEKIVNDCWWASTYIEFHAKDSNVWFTTPEIVSEETTFTIAPRNTYSFVYSQFHEEHNSFERKYKVGKEVTLPLPASDDDYTIENRLLGWYDNPDFTGSPVTKVSAADNTENKTFYGKLLKAFRLNEYGNEHNYDIYGELKYYLSESSNKDIAEGDAFTVTVSGVSKTNFDGGCNFVLADNTSGWKDCGHSYNQKIHLEEGEEFSKTFFIIASEAVTKEHSVFSLNVNSDQWDHTENGLIELEEFDVDFKFTIDEIPASDRIVEFYHDGDEDEDGTDNLYGDFKLLLSPAFLGENFSTKLIKGQKINLKITGKASSDNERYMALEIIDGSEKADWWNNLTNYGISPISSSCTEEDGFEIEAELVIETDSEDPDKIHDMLGSPIDTFVRVHISSSSMEDELTLTDVEMEITFVEEEE